MKIPALIVFTFFALLQSIQAGQTADARMYCLSIRFAQANSGGPNAIYSLDLTGVINDVNGELYPVFNQPRSHFSSLILSDEIFEDEIYGTLYLDVPGADNDGDGFPDIFDTSKPFVGGSSGTYSFPGFANSGNVTASWSRGAGSSEGTCRLNFQNLGEPFYHTFTILEYKGPLTYKPGTNVVSGDVNLTLTGVPDSELKGPVTFTKSATDANNQLEMSFGAWTNSIPEPPEIFPFLEETVSRDPSWPTNYFSYFEFDDWLLGTAEPDYYLWVLSIDDLNDSDHDGIPDFSDEPQVIAPRSPVLKLNYVAGNLSLTISGNIGQSCEIQDASAIDATTWSTISSVTLTNDPQTVSLPLPVTGTRFWRVRTP